MSGSNYKAMQDVRHIERLLEQWHTQGFAARYESAAMLLTHIRDDVLDAADYLGQRV